MGRIILFIVISLILCGKVQAQIILVDPGHGGDDKGAIGKGTVWRKGKAKRTLKMMEKDLALSLAKKIKNKLSKRYTAYLTRSVDRTLSLMERAEMADKLKVDLFISVHINSSTSRLSHGFETFYLDNNQDAAIKKVEEAENQGIPAHDPLVKKILLDLIIERTTKNSKKLAAKIHNKISKKIKTPFKMTDRGVKPGLFYVLALSKRPGVLLEVGFISNKKEFWKMRKADFQEAYAQAVLEGVNAYFGKTKKDKVPLL